MKLMCVVMTSLLLSFSAFAKDYKPGKYQVDTAHSKVGFEIPHLVISTVEGKFTDFSGTVQLDKKFNKSKIDVVISAKSIDTANSKRDDHLRSADFFDVEKNSDIKFVSTGITGTPDKFTVQGKLTMKGVTKPVTLDAQYLGTVKDGFGNEKAAFSAKTKLNRKDFGLTWNNVVEAGPVVGDQVSIDLRIQAALEQPKKK
ncbi:MAG: YceI family protein [Bdellovibrionaceae bacterium]|nr:YceI family protein [Pseudobdellovibrionaceae bacterium]